MTHAIVAKNRHDTAALVALRKALESGATAVRVAFLDGAPGAIFTATDLPAIRWKVICSM